MIDSHCHLADEKFVDDLDAVVARARDAGVEGVLCILSADDAAEVARAGLLSRVWPAVQYAAAIHPHAAGAYAGRAEDAARITAAVLEDTGAVAVGEIGLDYHYDLAPRAVQQEVFAAQVALAVARTLPIVIHTREAMDDTLAIIGKAGGPVRGVVHCFTGTLDEARRALNAGLYVSLSGIVTFPKADVLREVARFVPADRLLVETDAPFLAPVPHRSRRNEPAWVVETAAVIAAARGVALPELAARASANFRALVAGTVATSAR